MASSPVENTSIEDCGLAAYPVSRSNGEILADVPQDDKKPPNSQMFAKLAIDKEGRITHLRVLRLAYPNAPDSKAINQQALDFLKHWHYKPTLYQGKPVAVCSDVSVTVDF